MNTNTFVLKKIFDKVWSMKLENKTTEQIYQFLSLILKDNPPLKDAIFQIANQTQRCKEIVHQFSQGKDVVCSTEFIADKNSIIMLDLIPDINVYFQMLYACDLSLEMNNLGTVFLNNKVNFVVTNVKSIVEDPSILDKFFQHKITEDMFLCQQCGKAPEKNGMKCLHKDTGFTDKQICEECLHQFQHNAGL